MEFHIDKSLRRRCSSKIIGATTGGKIALTLCSICTVLFFVSLFPLIYYWDFERNTDEVIMWVCAAMAFSAFFMAGPFGLVCTCLRRNICVGLRKKERLFLEDGWLRYFFHIANDRDVNGLNEIAINLRECSLRLGTNGECVFTGCVFGWHYENILHNPLRSPDEMESVSSFEIWPYWLPDLYETLVAEQRCLALNNEEATTIENKSGRETSLYRGDAEEASNTPAIASETARAFVEVGKKPRPVVAFAWWFVAFILVCAVLWGISVGNLYSVVALVPLAYVTGFAKRAATATETRTVLITMTVSGGNVIIDMPGGRLYNGEYVDQRYVCDRALIDCIVLDEQVFRLQARSIQSIVSRAGVQLAVENLAYTEVSFRLDATGRERIGRLLAENGYAAPSSVG